MKSYAPAVIFLLICLGLLYAALNTLSYFDPISLCYIRINADLVSGNRSSIRQAIHLMKSIDQENYQKLCRNVTRIKERVCTGSDWHLDPGKRGYEASGCYIKGTKTVYLRPMYEADPGIIPKRMSTLRGVATLSAEYWNRK